MTHEEDTEANKEADFGFYLRDGLTCSSPMEASYFFGNRLHKKRDFKTCCQCGLAENNIPKPTREEPLLYSNVFYPCCACTAVADSQKRPKP